MDRTTKDLYEGDPVNWQQNGHTKYGFLGQDCPKGTFHTVRVRVVALDKTVWIVEVGKLSPTE